MVPMQWCDRSASVPPGGRFTYEFDAEPFGLHLYHCHIPPLAKHIAKGLYGAFIIDPKDGWPQPADQEMVMVMNGLDIDFDGVNDLYAVNTIPFHYDQHPIKIKVGALVRIFLVNILEYDLINEIAKRLNANVAWNLTAWDVMIESVRTGQFDIGADGITIKYEHPDRIERLPERPKHVLAGRQIAPHPGMAT